MDTNSLRKNYKIYLEPELADKALIMASKIKCRTRSKYIRYAVINQLIRDGFKLSEKFKPFVDKVLNKGMTTYH